MRLEFIAKETGRKIEDIVADAAENVALEYFRHRKDDPVETYKSSLQH